MYYGRRLILCSIILATVLGNAAAFRPVSVLLSSPDGRLSFQFEIRRGAPGYSVRYRTSELIDFSPLNICFDRDSLIQGLRLLGEERLDSTEEYALVTGRSKFVKDRFKQVRIFLKETHEPFRNIVLCVRAFDDGIAFRYELLPFRQGIRDSLLIRKESTAFRILGNPMVHSLVLPAYHNS
ncbi:MAG TPA: glycoside hydrolase family 97 N-terminal domain-containing protein, partial [Puia sp.]|nr:glycoside hydrolase family 97 N-terminal domain-containing protein [Puia sp.]